MAGPNFNPSILERPLELPLDKKQIQSLKKGAKRVANVAKKVVSPALAIPLTAATAANRALSNPTDPLTVGTAGIRAAADIPDSLINMATEDKTRPFNTLIDLMQAGGTGVGAGVQDFVSGKGLDKSLDTGSRAHGVELKRLQDITHGNQDSQYLFNPNLGSNSADVIPDGVSGAPASEESGINPGAPQSVRQENFAGTKLNLDEGYNEDGTYTRSLRNEQGEVVGTFDSQRRQTTDSPELVDELAENVSRRSIARGQASLDAKQASNPVSVVGKQIADLEEQLAQPERGPRQSFGDMLAERESRRNMRTQLDSLYTHRDKLVSSSQTQANSDRTFNLATAKFKQQQASGDRASRASAFKDLRDITTEFAKAQYPDEPRKQIGVVAKRLEDASPGFLFNTPEGQVYTREIKKDLVGAVRSESSLWDAWFGDKEPGQEDIESLSFKGWQIGEAGPWFGSPTVGKKGKSGNYAYLDNLTEEQVWILRQLIKRDNPGKGIREGQ